MHLTPAIVKEVRDLILMNQAARQIMATHPIARCTGKHAYPTHQLAMNGVSRGMGGSVNPYLCTTCGKWHVGQYKLERANLSKRTRFLRGSQR